MFFRRKVELLGFLAGRIPRRGWRQCWWGFRHRPVAYQAMDLAAFLPAQAATIVDVGAHAGDVAAALEFLYRPRQLWLVEPNPRRVTDLRRRFSGQTHVVIVDACLGAEKGSATFHLHEFDAASSLFACRPRHLEKFGFSGKQTEMTVPVTTLADLFAGPEPARIDLLKLDCQGAELAVLRGAGARLSTVRTILCEVAFEEIYARAPLFPDVHAFLRGAGFELVHLDGFAGAGRNIQWADALYANTAASFA